jgi:hypothetical protein
VPQHFRELARKGLAHFPEQDGIGFIFRDGYCVLEGMRRGCGDGILGQLR